MSERHRVTHMVAPGGKVHVSVSYSVRDWRFLWLRYRRKFKVFYA